MTDLVPASTLQIFGSSLAGVLLMLLGVSFAYKFYQAALMGKVNYWAGLENVHWIFHPITVFITPLFVHTAPKETNLIKTRTAGWVHLLFGPFFFLTSLMMLVSGADMLHLPGTEAMNFVLTCGNPNIPRAITYQPPFTYKFPILKKARRTMFKLLTGDIYLDKNKKMNPFDDSKRIKLWDEDEEDIKEDEMDRAKEAQQAAQQEADKARAAQQAEQSAKANGKK
jgi:hypothetical protein